jgi:hypothetical protein
MQDLRASAGVRRRYREWGAELLRDTGTAGGRLELEAGPPIPARAGTGRVDDRRLCSSAGRFDVQSPRRDALTPPGSARERWAAAVGRVIAAPCDTPTLGAWARLASVSRRSLCSYCQLAGASAKASLDLARLARTLRFRYPQGWRSEEHMVVSEIRTLLSLLDRTGLRHHYRCEPPAVVHVLSAPATGIPAPALDTLLRHLHATQGSIVHGREPQD